MPRHVKHACGSDPAYGCAPAERPLGEHVARGVVILDKPAGPTSRQAAEAVRRLTGASRVGHGGTLDPAVTGVLPVLFGRSTPVAAILLGCDKSYEGVMSLHGDVSDAELRQAMVGFRGVIEQTPPRRSRVVRRPRLRAVETFDVTSREGRLARFEVRCQGGTYIRKLVHDLGQALGCGAHMVGLRRTQSGPFVLADCSTIEDVEEAVGEAKAGREGRLRRIVRAVEDVISAILPRVWVDDGAVESLCGGFPLAVPGICALEDFLPDDRVAVMTAKGELIGVGRTLLGSGEALERAAGLAVQMSRIIMERGTYPKWSGGRKGGREGPAGGAETCA